MALAFKTTWTAQSQWHEVDTPVSYLKGLINWCDSARDTFYFDQRLEGVVGKTLQETTVVRAHRLRVVTDRIAHNTHVSVTTWLSRVGVRSFDMSHEIFVKGTQTQLAVCTTTLVVVQDGRAKSIPKLEVLQQFAFPSGMAIPELTAERHPEAHKYSFTVRPSDIDGLGHVHNATYFSFLHDATIDALREHAISTDFKSLVADTVYIDYIASALVHDPLSVVVWPVDGADCHALSFQMLREGQTLVRASITFKKAVAAKL